MCCEAPLRLCVKKTQNAIIICRNICLSFLKKKTQNSITIRRAIFVSFFKKKTQWCNNLSQ